MRVLVLSQYYDPEPVEKVHDLARGLVRLGHDVQVLTGFPCYPSGRIYAGYRQRLRFREEKDGVKIVRVPQYPNHSRSALLRAVYYLSFAFSAALLGARNTTRPDIIIVYQAALPVGIAARVLSRAHRAPYVLDVVDLWPESVSASGMLSSRIAARLIRRIASWIYRGATAISVVTEGFRRNLVKHGVAPEKLTVIENWMPSETYKRAERDPELATREGLAGRFNVMYAGNMGPYQDLGTVIEAASLLKDLQDVQFVLVGDGLEYPRLRALADQRGLTNVRFLGRRPPEAMSALYALADVLLVHLKPDQLTELSIPSKTFAYMPSGRPVLMAVAGDAQEFVRANRFGVGVPPSDPAKMAEAVRWFRSLDREKLREMGHAAVAAYEEKYCSDVQIRRVEALLRKAHG